MIGPKPVKPYLRLLGAIVIALSLTSCGAYVDLDVTFFSAFDLDDSLADLQPEQLPEAEIRKQVIKRTPVDLSDKLDSEISTRITDVVVDELYFRIPTNELGADLHEVTVMIGPWEAESPDSPDVHTLTYRDVLKQGETIPTTPIASKYDTDIVLSDLIEARRFALFVSGFVVVGKGNIPGGHADVEIDVIATVHVGP